MAKFPVVSWTPRSRMRPDRRQSTELTLRTFKLAHQYHHDHVRLCPDRLLRRWLLDVLPDQLRSVDGDGFGALRGTSHANPDHPGTGRGEDEAPSPT